MIFVCLGTQIYPFDRLLKEIDRLVEKGVISDDVFIQTGTLNYIPKHVLFSQYLSHDEFDDYRKRANLIISHGGTGALIGASKLGKNIIGVPRLSIFGEHVDDHQLQIVKVLEEQGYIRAVYEIEDLEKVLMEALNKPICKKFEEKATVLPIIDSYISFGHL